MTDRPKIRKFVEANGRRFVETLKEACSHPSISAEGLGLEQMSGWLEDRLRGMGVSTLLIEQNARAALNTADYAYVLETGDIVREGASRDLLHDETLTQLYLGGEVSESSHHPIAQ